MPKRIQPRWTHLLQIPAIAAWHGNMARKNASTADVYLRRLGRGCHNALGKTPDALLKLNQDELEDAVSLCIDHEFKRGQLGSSVVGVVKALKSFLKWHGRKVERPNAIPGANEYPNADNYQIPDQAALHAVLKRAHLRTQVMIVMVGQGGQRLRVLGNIDGDNGLRLGDLQDLRLTADDVGFRTIPARVLVPRTLSKNGKPYQFFIGPEACATVLAYLRQRLKAGEALKPDSPLVRAHGGKPRFMLRNNIGDCMRRPMRASGIEAPPYIWRSYYANRCQLAEPHGFLEAWRKFFMGHAGNIQTQYANRKQLPADSIETMRAAYAKALPYLETTLRAPETPLPEIASVVLRAAGLTATEVLALDVKRKTADELASIMQDALTRRASAAAPQAPTPPVAPQPVALHHGLPRQKIVNLADLASALADGWSFRTTLPGDQAIVEHG